MSTPLRARRDRKGLLVVDDERLIRWSIREALRGQYRVWTAESAERALRMLHRLKNLHGLLVDIRLPGASGYELIAQARVLRPDLKVFVMTGYDQESAPRQAFSVRADGYLSKPFLMDTLKDMMVSHLMTLPPRAEKSLRSAGNL
ncbi:MAG TPA: response regulator [Planctomycetota bacterium]|nr:response regulator [Planctomycetota bacterium]